MTKCDDHERCQQETRDLWVRIESCEQDIAAIREAVGRGEERTRTLFTLLEKIEKNIENLIIAVDNLKMKPARQWDIVSAAVITGIIGAAIGYFITKGTP